MNEEFFGIGTVEKKEEGLTKAGKKYFKVKVDGISGNLFDFEMGGKFGIGDQVDYKGEKNKGTNPVTGDEIIFHNFKEIIKKEIPVETVKISEEEIVIKPNTTEDIHKQVFLKCAANIVEKGTSAIELVAIAKKIKEEYDKWWKNLQIAVKRN